MHFFYKTSKKNKIFPKCNFFILTSSTKDLPGCVVSLPLPNPSLQKSLPSKGRRLRQASYTNDADMAGQVHIDIYRSLGPPVWPKQIKSDPCHCNIYQNTATRHVNDLQGQRGQKVTKICRGQLIRGSFQGSAKLLPPMLQICSAKSISMSLKVVQLWSNSGPNLHSDLWLRTLPKCNPSLCSWLHCLTGLFSWFCICQMRARKTNIKN